FCTTAGSVNRSLTDRHYASGGVFCFSVPPEFLHSLSVNPDFSLLRWVECVCDKSHGFFSAHNKPLVSNATLCLYKFYR
ncbi:hypothetical protein, partial [Atlantibacter sp.]|uniref:hypothetical protein n=1 Tax=Atlantibacter sp. TaxID=1903473 RepID=UPI0028A606EC